MSAIHESRHQRPWRPPAAYVVRLGGMGLLPRDERLFLLSRGELVEIIELVDVRKMVARTRLSVDAEQEPLGVRWVGAAAVTEVLAPSSDRVDLHEVLIRGTWAILQAQGATAAIDYLLEIDAAVSEIAAAR